MFMHKPVRRWARRLAAPVALSFLWTFCLAPAVQAAAVHTDVRRDAHRAPGPPRPKGNVRPLTPGEMERILGRQMNEPEWPDGMSPDPGTPYAWDGSHGGTNTNNGNRLTRRTLVSWTAKGGLGAGFTLTHNSRSRRNAEVGQKWSHSYDLVLSEDSLTGAVTAHWGDDRAYRFTLNADGSYTPPAGIHDTLVQVNASTHDLTTRDQVRYRFTGSGQWRYASSLTDPNGNTVTLNRNAGNLVTSVVDPTSRTLTLGYDANNRISTVTDPLNRQWTLSYDASGDLTRITWPAVGGSTYNEQFAYDANHNITTHTDRRGSAWTASYDADSRVLWVRDPLLNQTGYTYLSNPERVEIADPNGKLLTHEYDASGRLVQEKDALNFTATYLWDGSNNRTQVTDRRGKIWTFGYDTRGNQTSATNPLLKTVNRTFNSKNRLLTVTTPLGHQVVNTYDQALNWNLTEVQQKAAGGAVLSTTTFTHNPDGSVASRTDPNNRTTTYGYSTHGELTRVTTPGNRVRSWGRSTLGAITSRTDALNRTTTYTLDNWERRTGTTYPDNSTRSFSFDANSNLTGWSDGQGTWSRAYDAANRTTSEALNSVTRFAYAYDAAGKKGLLSSMTDSASRTFTYSYTDRSQLATVVESPGNLTASYTYNENGAETGLTNPNGTTVTRVFDDAGRLTSVVNRNSGGTTLSSFAYGHNDDDLRTSCTEADGSVVSWTYNGAHRLTGESRTGTNPYSKTYVLDGTGNRTSQTVGGVTTSFSYSADDELTGTSGGFANSYGYNANGEQTSRTLSGTAYTLAWDYDGQLASITQGSTTVSFGYDGLGRRISRTAGGTTTQFLVSGDRIYLEAVGGTATAYYSYGNSLLRKDGEYPLFDGHGSERTVTNASQAVTGTVNYDSFGNTVGTTGSSTSPYMYGATSGYRNDGDAGLMHVGARYYDAQVGRFISRDRDLTEHPYLYCEHEPVNHLDADGDSPAVITGGLVVPGVREVIVVVGIVAVGGYLVIEIGKSIGDSIHRMDDLERWHREREARKRHKEDGREDRRKRKQYEEELEKAEPGERVPDKPKMKHKQKDARNY